MYQLTISNYTIGAEQSCMAFIPCRVVKERPPLPAGKDKIRVSFRRVVGQAGLEPATPRLSSACSNQLSYKPFKNGGAEEIRTPDILLAKQALYQLSYCPVIYGRSRFTAEARPGFFYSPVLTKSISLFEN